MVKVESGRLRRGVRALLPLFQAAKGSSAFLDKLEGSGLGKSVLAVAKRALEERVFRGELGEVFHCLGPEPSSSSLLLLGLGDRSRLNPETLTKVFGGLSRRCRKEGVREVALLWSSPDLQEALIARGGAAAGAKALATAWVLGGYAFDTYKPHPTRERKAPAVLQLALDRADATVRRAVDAGIVVGDSANFSRELANTPPNDLYPEKLAEHARALARAEGLKFRLLRKQDLGRLGMGGILGVGQASAHPPCLMTLEYRPRKRVAGLKTLVLVGKAITFDSGGLSIKPAKGMEEMKFDMAGGAAVLGAMRAVARLAPALRVVGIVPSAENAVGSAGFRPSDILRMASGKTVEVLNTDAEGRLILADALHHAQGFNPDYIVDFATLTGACVVALGVQVSGLVTNDRDFALQVFEAGERAGERVWQLPLYDEFLEATKSTLADLRNSAGRNGGAITAAAFLSNFVGKTPWCHLDIAGTAWAERESGPFQVGATGVGVRLVEELLQRLA